MSFLKSLDNNSSKFSEPFDHWELNKPLTDDQIKQQERAQDSISYVKLNKQEQVDKLDSLGLTKKEIRALRYEKDRVNKLLELMNE